MKRRALVGKLCGALALLAGAAAPLAVLGQEYPAKPIRLVVGVPPGGATDAVARIVGQKLAEQMGQPVLVENRGGAGGNIGAEVVAKSPPDGYTLFLAVIGTMAINQSLYKDMPFDTVRDFAPISQLTSMPQLLLVHPSVPANTVQEFIAYARSHPGQLNFASGGNGTATHLAGELFKAMSGTQLVHVPYKGNGPAMTDLLAGRVSAMFDQVVSGLPHVTGGKLRGLGVTTAKRSPAAPDIPTIAESGLAGYEVSTWHGLVAPAGTPPRIIQRLQREVVKALESDDVRKKFAANGIDPVSSTPEQFGAFMKAEIGKWSETVKAAGVAPN
jgi:tripartite-type tricarboxylate transporter receptor subunit TctC